MLGLQRCIYFFSHKNILSLPIKTLLQQSSGYGHDHYIYFKLWHVQIVLRALMEERLRDVKITEPAEQIVAINLVFLTGFRI